MVINLNNTEYQLRVISLKTDSLNALEQSSVDTLSDTWIAHISLSNVPLNISLNEQPDYNKSPKKYQKQQKIVRQLLTELLTTLDIRDNCCYEKSYPYRLAKTGYYVCFSHTADAYAVIVSKHHSVGIDIEYGEVSWKVASRYFHKNELLILSTLATNIKKTLCLQLWQIKECLIKINNQTLAAGMGVDLSFLITRLQNKIMASSHSQCPYQLILTENDKLQLNPTTNVPVFAKLSKSIHHIWIHSTEKIMAIF